MLILSQSSKAYQWLKFRNYQTPWRLESENDVTTLYVKEGHFSINQKQFPLRQIEPFLLGCYFVTLVETNQADEGVLNQFRHYVKAAFEALNQFDKLENPILMVNGKFLDKDILLSIVKRSSPYIDSQSKGVTNETIDLHLKEMEKHFFFDALSVTCLSGFDFKVRMGVLDSRALYGHEEMWEENVKALLLLVCALKIEDKYKDASKEITVNHVSESYMKMVTDLQLTPMTPNPMGHISFICTLDYSRYVEEITSDAKGVIKSIKVAFPFNKNDPVKFKIEGLLSTAMFDKIEGERVKPLKNHFVPYWVGNVSAMAALEKLLKEIELTLEKGGNVDKLETIVKIWCDDLENNRRLFPEGKFEPPIPVLGFCLKTEYMIRLYDKIVEMIENLTKDLEELKEKFDEERTPSFFKAIFSNLDDDSTSDKIRNQYLVKDLHRQLLHTMVDLVVEKLRRNYSR